MNDRTYPLFTRFLNRLNVTFSATDMSFSYYCKATGLQYGSSSVNSVMAQRANLLKPSYWKFLFEITRFFKTARHRFESNTLAGITLGEFLGKEGFSERFRDQFLLPMSAAIWSASDRDMKTFPMEAFVRFFENHGLLSVADHPQWYYIKGGSQTYVEAFLSQFPGTVMTRSPVQSIVRNDSGVSITLGSCKQLHFDSIVIAAHADQALAMLDDPSENEKRLLSPWRYSTNHVILHTDTSLLPTNLRARASWNTIREKHHASNSPITVTYDMTRLQKLPSTATYCVTLNPANPIANEKVLVSLVYAHPIFDFPAMDTQSQLKELNGSRNTWFCGSYFGYGFHEDAVRSSVDVARALGVEL